MANATHAENARLRNGAEGTRDPERTRRLILESASALFAKLGPNVATMEQIARQAGYSKRMAYHFFGSKEGLYQEVIKHVYGRVTRVTAESAGKSVGLSEVVDQLLQEYFSFLQKNPEFVALLNWENSHDVEGLKQVDLRSFVEPVCAVVRAAIERDQPGKQIDDTQVIYIIMTCLALCGYYFSNQKSVGALFEIDLSKPALQQRWLDHIRTLVVQGLSGCYED
ncbi:MAG: TetR/AcrR family transcriptional regulator [Planctomycetes bacterium]|nr:TetR/AcrR family transcriptional regulator [Planctomycetota bacterium]